MLRTVAVRERTAPVSHSPERVPTQGAGMLVLSRKMGESIVIDEKIVITVVEIRGDKVRLGIEAPRDVPIHRQEIYQALLRAQQEAAHAPEATENQVPTGDAN